MKTYTKAELNHILKQHELWLADPVTGVRANLRSADLSGANLSGAHLSGADLSGAYLRGANLYGAYLRGADLCSADLSGAVLRSADLSGAHLSGADLCSAVLRSAVLRSADLSGADLSGAYLRGANLSGADLCSAVLRSADLSGAHLRSADLCSALLPPATTILQAQWGTVPDDLCVDLMIYDAWVLGGDALPRFNAWAKGGPCPYGGTNTQRAAFFTEVKTLWGQRKTLRPKPPADLVTRLFKYAGVKT